MEPRGLSSLEDYHESLFAANSVHSDSLGQVARSIWVLIPHD